MMFSNIVYILKVIKNVVFVFKHMQISAFCICSEKCGVAFSYHYTTIFD